MRARAYISHLVRFVGLITADLFLLLACEESEAWGYTLEDLPGKLGRAPDEVFAELSEDRLSEIVRLGPEWPMIAALAARESDREELAVALLRRGERDAGPRYRRIYLEQLVSELLGQQRYPEAEAHSRELVGMDPNEVTYRHWLLQSLYWQRRDAEVTVQLDAMEKLSLDALSRFDRDEMRLMRAASTARQSVEGWREMLFSLFVDLPISEIHYRAWAFIRSHPSWFELFSEDQLAIMRALAVASERSSRALDLMPSVVTSGEWRFTRQFLDTVGRLYLDSGRLDEGVATMGSVRDRGSDELRPRVVFWTGRFSRNSGQYEQAAGAFTEALALAAAGPEAERARWYVIDTSRQISVERAIAAIRIHGPAITNAPYYDDTFETLISDSVRARQWESCQQMIDLIGRFGSASARAQVYYLSRALIMEGLIDGAVSPELPPADRAAGPTLSYYRVAAGESAAFVDLSSITALLVDQEEGDPVREVLRGLLAAEMVGLLDSWLRSHERSLLPADYVLVARMLAQAGEHSQAMRVADRALRRFGDVDHLLHISFPRAYSEILEAAAEVSGVSSALFYALVREESYFDPAARSPVGASGLSQLMPATAADMSSRMGMRAIDIDDPRDNLVIGAEYLAYLVRLFDSEFLGVVAYNAGLGRVREWIRAFGDLPRELFLEAIPFAETRAYVRKIVTALWYYERLYPDIVPASELPLVLRAQ